jgi:hypothetical protein
VDEEYVRESVVPVAFVKVVDWSDDSAETVRLAVVRAPVRPASVPVARRKFRLPLSVRKEPLMPFAVVVPMTFRAEVALRVPIEEVPIAAEFAVKLVVAVSAPTVKVPRLSETVFATFWRLPVNDRGTW